LWAQLLDSSMRPRQSEASVALRGQGEYWGELDFVRETIGHCTIRVKWRLPQHRRKCWDTTQHEIFICVVTVCS
jgi:hypothetical protein